VRDSEHPATGFSTRIACKHAPRREVVEARYSGTFKATGKRMNAQACHVWDVKDGKVSRFQQSADTAKLHEVMGTI
jgi:ketosteroid isomerase-like protein